MNGKNKIILLDTNVIIRYLLNDEEKLCKKANEIFSSIALGHSKAIVLETVFTEVVFILTKVYTVPKDKVKGALSSILQYKGIINEDKQSLNASLELFTSTNLHIVDCILAAKAKYYHYELVTFDQKLNKTFAHLDT
jgi:predicted nucleic-acid-binding protein